MVCTAKIFRFELADPGGCWEGVNCPFAHTVDELRVSTSATQGTNPFRIGETDKFKTRLCRWSMRMNGNDILLLS